MPDLELLSLIDRAATAATARDRETADVGPFRALLDPSTDLIYLNYAALTGPFDDASIHPLLEHFRARKRRPRFELCEDLWPDAAVALERHGFTLELRQPMMVCRRGEFRPRRADGVDVEILIPHGDAHTFLTVANAAFGLADPPSNAQITLTLEGVERRSLRCAIARFEGEPAGVATTTPLSGVAELAGVGTLERFRRRGVASTASTVLLEDHFRDGEIAWLSPGDDAAEAVYRKLGFERAGFRRSYIL